MPRPISRLLAASAGVGRVGAAGGLRRSQIHRGRWSQGQRGSAFQYARLWSGRTGAAAGDSAQRRPPRPDCDKQWELPFAVATSYGWDETDRVAWVRALNVDERLSVVAVAAEGRRLAPRRRGCRIGGGHSDDSERMLEAFATINANNARQTNDATERSTV